MITEEEIKEEIRKNKFFNVYEYYQGLSSGEKEEFNKFVNSILTRRSVKGTLPPLQDDEIIGSTNERGELIFIFPKKVKVEKKEEKKK